MVLVSIRRRLPGCMPEARARSVNVMPRAATRARIAANSPPATMRTIYADVMREGARRLRASDIRADPR